MCKRYLGTVFGAAVLVVLTGCYLFPKEERVLAPPLIRAPEISYDTIKVKRGTVEKRIIGSASFVSVTQANQFFKQSGVRLKGIYVSIGDEVEVGDLLGELETASLENDIARQKIVLRKAELNYERIKSGLEDQTALKLAAIDMEAADLRLRDLESQYEQIKLLFDFERTSSLEKNLNDLTSSIENQQLNIRKLKLQYEKMKREQEDERPLTLADFDVELAKLQMTDLERRLEETRLYATVAGNVVYINYSLTEGDVVGGYQTIVRIADPDRIHLEYSGHQTSDFKLGMTVDVRIKQESYLGRVIMTPRDLPIDADEVLKDKIRMEVFGTPPEVGMGTQASISLTLAKQEDVLVLPRGVVRSYLGRRYVQVLNNGVREERDVQLGLESATEVEIADGLKEGEEVIIR